MSDTAKAIEMRLADELRRLADSGPMTHMKTQQLANHMADAVEIACDRIRQLERGIERTTKWVTLSNGYTSLLQLIEELGNEKN